MGNFGFTRQGDLNDLQDKIKKHNSTEFSFDINDDALYQQYKDNYIKQGQLAKMDTMGTAQAKTGGYANSYAQSVGQQAFNAELDGLNDVALNLYTQAYNRYKDEEASLYNQYNLLANEREAAYQKYRDSVADARYNTDFIYGRVVDKLNMGIMPSTEEMNLAGFTNADVEAVINNSAVDDSEFYKAEYARKDPTTGDMIYMQNGKEVRVRAGANPYTGDIHKDLLDENGKYDPSKAWPNTPYQPNHIVITNANGEKESMKLSKTGKTDVVNGVTQNVWQTPDGQLWIWDGTKNKYLIYEE